MVQFSTVSQAQLLEDALVPSDVCDRDPPDDASDLVGIVFRWKSKKSRHHDKGQHRIELRLRPVYRGCQLVAEAIELGEKGE